jgi:predicted lipid-binding transport protein (Tim44 family)
MDSVPYADIVILALIAGFILLRLRGVLGQKTGNDNPQFFKRDIAEKEAADDKIVHIGDKAHKLKGIDMLDSYLSQLQNNDPISKTLADVKKLDPQFSATAFMDGAKMAYEMVFDAFAKGDKATLEMLLEKNLYQTFLAEIDARVGQDLVTETTLLRAKAKDITSATLTGNIVRLSVKFESEQVSIVKNKQGEVVEGDASESHLMDDEWLFERDVTSKNPNWKIIET